jgi:hypothetical protein
MSEKLPGDKGSGQNPERSRSEVLEQRREVIMQELKALIDEEHKLIATFVTDEALIHLAELSHRQANLIDQLGMVEREITAQRSN